MYRVTYKALKAQEGRSPNSSSPPFLNAKNSVRIGSWNVRTMWETARSAQVAKEEIPRVALRWTPQGKRKQDRPKATLRKTFEKEIKAMSLTWGEAEMLALDRIGWRQRVQASCSMRS